MVARILRRIRNGELKRGEQLGTEVKLAEANDISVMTVRRALDSLVEEGVIERRRGRGLFVAEPFRASRIIQVVVPSLTHDECVNMIRGLQECAQQSDYDVQVSDAHSDYSRVMDLISRLPRGTARGAVIRYIHDSKFAAAIYELHRQHFPFVVVDHRLADLDVSSVTSDNYGAGYLAGEELLKRGHRRIALVMFSGVRTSEQRLEGLRDALNDAGYPFKRSWRQEFQVSDPLGDWSGAIDEATAQVMRQQDRPTAILYGNDRSAIFGCRTLQRLGFRIPDDVSVIGNGNTEVGTLVRPTLATLKQPSVEQGREAYRLLRGLLNEPSTVPRHVKLPVGWIPRESVGPAPDSGKRTARIQKQGVCVQPGQPQEESERAS